MSESPAAASAGDDERDADGEILPACPECGAGAMKRKSPTGVDRRDHPEDWFCRQCFTHVDEPVWRDRQRGNYVDGTDTLAGRLARADPDDVGADLGSEEAGQP